MRIPSVYYVNSESGSPGGTATAGGYDSPGVTQGFANPATPDAPAGSQPLPAPQPPAAPEQRKGLWRTYQESIRSYDSQAAITDVLKKHTALHDDVARTVSSTGSEYGKPAANNLLAELPRSTTPLSNEEAYVRQQEYGRNTVRFQPKTTWWRTLLNSIVHPFNLILVVLAVVQGSTGELTGMSIMFVMIVISVALRFIQEYRSATAAEALASMVSTKSTVVRYESANLRADREKGGPDVWEVNLEDVVPGDIIKVMAGNIIPADCRVLWTRDLYISQSCLNGESVPVEKLVLKIPSHVAGNYRERLNMPVETPDVCFMGTHVVSGVAYVEALRIGRSTFLGEIAQKLAKRRPMNAFQKGIRRVSYMFVGTMACMLPVVLVLDGVLKHDWMEALMFAISVAVGLTPEMLPMIVNANLARGAMIMSKSKCIVKRLDSIINLGSVDVLCTDKTGTLTKDEVCLVKHLTFQGAPSMVPLKFGFMNSQLQTGWKNLMDTAIVNYSENTKQLTHLLQDIAKIDELPFDFVRRRVSVVAKNRKGGVPLLVCKGAVEEILTISTHITCEDDSSETDANQYFMYPHQNAAKITEEQRHISFQMNQRLSEQGLRVLAVAFKPLSDFNGDISVKDEKDMIFCGFLAFLDPPKETSAEAIANLMNHGVEVKVLSGDNPAVCQTVCQEIGLPVKGVITGADLMGLNERQLAKAAIDCTIFAKLNPVQKADIIKALKKKDKVVGFLGDGINDGLALRESDAGISVDTGSDVAKDAADIILLEKSLTVVSDGVITGRITYGNTIKYIKMAVSSAFGNMFSVLVASAWLPYLPMSSLQIIILNLLYDISQISIPWDNVDKDFLMKPRRWSAMGIVKFMVFIGPISSIFDITTYVFMYYYYDIKNEHDVYKVALFQSAWFVESLMTQTLVVHMIRSDKMPVFQSNASWPVVLLTTVMILIGMTFPYIPYLNTAVKMVPLPGMFFAYCISAVLLYCVLTQLVKMVYVRCFKTWM